MTEKSREQKTYPNTTYKIYPFYNKIFESFFFLYQRNELTERLIEMNYKDIKVADIPNYDKPELLEVMIEDLKKVYSKRGVLPAIYTNNEYIREIRDLYNENFVSNDIKRSVFNARISPKAKKEIKNMAKITETIGELIEIAIGYHLYKNKQYFEIIKLTFSKKQY